MPRLERLTAQLRELEQREQAERSELLGLAERDDELTPEEEARFSALAARFDEQATWADEPQLTELRSQIARLEAVAAAPERALERPAVQRSVPANPLAWGVEYGAPEQVRGAARSAIEVLSHAPDSVRAALTRTLERAEDPSGKLARHMVAASRDEYRSAFSKLISGRSWAITPDEARAVEAVRAASLTDGLGGYAVPTVLDPTLILTGTHDGLVPNPIRQLANVRQITGDNLTVVSTAGVTASYVAEGTEGTDDAPSLTALTLTPYKAHVTVPFTIEIEGDWAGMESEMRRLIAVAKDDLEQEKFAVGTGSTQPLGLFYDIYTNYTGQVQASAGSNVFAKEDVFALAEKVAARFRGRGQWIANDITYDKVRLFETGGSFMWAQSLAVGMPSTLLGAPVYSNPQVDATFGSGENYIMGFGDVREAYTIVDRLGLTVELVPHLFGANNNLPNGMRALYAYWRNGARVVNSGAFAVLNIT